jgi:hypothetical protein
MILDLLSRDLLVSSPILDFAEYQIFPKLIIGVVHCVVFRPTLLIQILAVA